MRILPVGMAEDLSGSAGDVSMQFNIWYDGQMAFADVPVNNWGIAWNSTQQVMGQGTFAIVDADAAMIPWGYDDPLSVGGGRVQTKLHCAGASVDLGFQRITRSEPAESWRLYMPNGVKLWISGTHIINVQADDATTEVSANRFLAPETPPAGATVFSEFARVASPYMLVIIDGSLSDRSVPATVVYKDDRLATLQQLADAVSAGLRVNGSGQLVVYPLGATTPVVTFAGGTHDASLVGTKRSANYSGLYNGVVSTNTLPSGQAIQGTAFQSGGPLGWDGPHGHVPYFHNATFATDQSSINKDAATQLATIIRNRSSSITFTSTLHPELETGDCIRLMMPIHDGSEQPLDGILSQVKISGSGNVAPTMDYIVDVPDTSIQAIAAANRTKWLQT